MYRVVKRDNSVAEFDIKKISEAIIKAFEATEKQYNNSVIDLLALKVTADFEPKIKDGLIAVEDIQYIIAKLKYKNIGVIITDHNVGETLAITDRAYLLYEGTILQEGTPAALAADEDVRTKYLGAGFVLKRSVSVQKAQDEHEAKLALNKK